MEVIQAQSAGFCWGVRRAVECALDTAAATPGTIYTDGPLIHNPGMIAELERRGICVTHDPRRLAPGVTLLIRAHGIPPEHRRDLQRLSLNLVDATCPEVARIQAAIRIHVAKGYEIFIYGDEGHAEVVGLCGHAMGRGHVITRLEDVQTLPHDYAKVCLVAQSTQDPEGYRRIAEAVRTRYPETAVLDTICEATKRRQGELRELARRCDKIVVVGSKTSANSLRLAEIAAQYRPTLMVGEADELRSEDFKDVAVVGLTAGASTPDSTIAAVRDKLASMVPCPRHDANASNL